MNDDDRFDFSAIDPARDGERWEARVRGVATRAIAARQRRTVACQLVKWTRPALALAAAAALSTWMGALVSSGRTRAVSQESERTTVLATWAATGEQPSTDDILDVLGGSE